MDEMEFTEAESNMNDLVSEYQQYQGEQGCGLGGRCGLGHVLTFPFQSSLTHPLLPPSPTLADASAEEEGEYDEEA